MTQYCCLIRRVTIKFITRTPSVPINSKLVFIFQSSHPETMFELRRPFFQKIRMVTWPGKGNIPPRLSTCPATKRREGDYSANTEGLTQIPILLSLRSPSVPPPTSPYLRESRLFSFLSRNQPYLEHPRYGRRSIYFEILTFLLHLKTHKACILI